MTSKYNRREFLSASAFAAAGLVMANHTGRLPAAKVDDPPFRISLAEWSLHRSIFGGALDHLDFARTAKEQFGIEAVEYVNQFFKDKARDQAYLADMKTRCADAGVRSLLIMIDGEGHLGDPDEAQRLKAVENHKPWVEAAATLGCHSIRVNAASSGSYEEQQALAADGLLRLTLFAEQHQLNVIVENHGGLSSNGAWLAGVMQRVNHPHCGTLPDFGNFALGDGTYYDHYQGIEEMMPYAQAVSAKSMEFDDSQPLATIDRHDPAHPRVFDYARLMKIVTDAGYHGYVGIEYEGSDPDESTGIRKTKELLERVRALYA
ncbi:MAG: sugar phosphate isomerase/epimerase [Planctomycetaceae bacterium]|nr:sugar phosphate isomerase/epimerase [Planctomycetaceae bacterium]